MRRQVQNRIGWIPTESRSASQCIFYRHLALNGAGMANWENHRKLNSDLVPGLRLQIFSLNKPFTIQEVEISINCFQYS